MVVLATQPRFHGVAAGAVLGHSWLLIVRFCRARVTLNVDWYNSEAELTCVITFCWTAAWSEKSPVYEQSVATPIKATFRVVGQPAEFPIVEARLTPPVFPDAGEPPSID